MILRVEIEVTIDPTTQEGWRNDPALKSKILARYHTIGELAAHRTVEQIEKDAGALDGMTDGFTLNVEVEA